MSPPCWWSSGCVRCWIDIWNKDDVSKIRDLNDGHPTNPMFSRDLQDRGPLGRWLARVTHRRNWRYNLANNKLTVQTYPFVQPTRKKSTLCNRRIPNEEPKLPWFIKEKRYKTNDLKRQGNSSTWRRHLWMLCTSSTTKQVQLIIEKIRTVWPLCTKPTTISVEVLFKKFYVNFNVPIDLAFLFFCCNDVILWDKDQIIQLS